MKTLKLFRLFGKKNNSRTQKSTARKTSSGSHKKPQKLNMCKVCKPLADEKYKSRPSPSCHAADCHGQMAEGTVHIEL